MKTKTYTRTCPICKKKFKTTKYNQKYCSIECQGIAMVQTHKKALRNYLDKKITERHDIHTLKQNNNAKMLQPVSVHHLICYPSNFAKLPVSPENAILTLQVSSILTNPPLLNQRRDHSILGTV